MAFIESGKSFDKEENYKKMKKKMENMSTKGYMLPIPTHIYKKLKLKSVENSVTLKSILMDAIYKYLEK